MCSSCHGHGRSVNVQCHHGNCFQEKSHRHCDHCKGFNGVAPFSAGCCFSTRRVNRCKCGPHGGGGCCTSF